MKKNERKKNRKIRKGENERKLVEKEQEDKERRKWKKIKGKRTRR